MAIVLYRSLNENGRYIGESHPKAKLSDDDVNRMRDMSERLNLSTRFIARTMEVPRRTVRSILSYENRAQYATRVIKYVEPS